MSDWEDDSDGDAPLAPVRSKYSDSEEESDDGPSQAGPKAPENPMRPKQVAKEKRRAREEAAAKARAEIAAARAAQSKLTPEEERMAAKRAVEDADFQNATDLFGAVAAEELPESIDASKPKTAKEFDEFRKLLVKKFETTRTSGGAYYLPFLESLLRDVTAGLKSDDVKKLASVLNVVANDKTKSEKIQRDGKKKKGSGKKGLQMQRDTLSAFKADDDYDPYSDFM